MIMVLLLALYMCLKELIQLAIGMRQLNSQLLTWQLMITLAVVYLSLATLPFAIILVMHMVMMIMVISPAMHDMCLRRTIQLVFGMK